MDPYTLEKKDLLYDKEFYPDITCFDVATYLLHAPSPVTHEEMRNYRSMDAHHNFYSGWVREIGVKPFNDEISIIRGKVMHSQRVGDTPAVPWVIAEAKGPILFAHCNCMAGLGESCSHVSIKLFYILVYEKKKL